MMTVEYQALPDGALLMKVVSDAFATYDEFWESESHYTCMKALVSALDRCTDTHLVDLVNHHRRHGGDIEVELRRSDGSPVPHYLHS